MAETSQDSPASSNRPGSTPGMGLDPLASLYRMSTTAGAASQEYVAINLFAILAVIGGVFTALIFMSSMFLIIPATTLVLGIVSLRQICNSNGTQTGRVGSWLGIVLALGLSSALAVSMVSAQREAVANRQQVLALCDQLQQALLKPDYNAAYAMFTERFHEEKKIDPEQLRLRFEHLAPPSLGKLESVKSNGLVEWLDTGEPGLVFAQTKLIFKWSGSSQQARFDVTFVHTPQGGWQVADLPQIFPTPQAAPPGRSGGPGAGAGPQ